MVLGFSPIDVLTRGYRRTHAELKIPSYSVFGSGSDLRAQVQAANGRASGKSEGRNQCEIEVGAVWGVICRPKISMRGTWQNKQSELLPG